MISSEKGARRPLAGHAVRAVIKVVSSRRALTYVSLFAVALALAVLTSGAGAASKCEALSTTSYTDPVGDGTGANAPDITGVTVTSYEDGSTAFQVAIADRSEFSTDMLVRTFVDSDKNPATGNDKGFEYMIQAQRIVPSDYVPSVVECEDQPVAKLFKWNGSGWGVVEAKTLSSWYGDSSLTVRINASELGNAMIFNFAVYAASNVNYDPAGTPQLTGASFDWAPNTGTYSYQPFDYSSYADAVGDGSGAGAPDITKVVVTKWKSGLLKFWIGIPGTAEFGEDMLMRVYVDSDSNASTGDSRGYDYMIQGQRAAFSAEGNALRTISGLLRSTCYQPTLRLFSWSESAWTAAETDSLNSWYDKGLKFSIDAADLGGVKAFNFGVYAATKVVFDDSGTPSLENVSYDWAPDTGSYAFPLTAETAPLVGAYRVIYRVTSSHNFGNLKRGSTSARTWKFVRSCKKNKCTTKVVAGRSLAFKLSRTGKAYKANAGTKFDCQAGRSARGTERYQLKVKKSGWVKGKWRVTKWAGTVRVVSPDNHVSACGGAASYSASLTGTLK